MEVWPLDPVVVSFAVAFAALEVLVRLASVSKTAYRTYLIEELIDALIEELIDAAIDRLTDALIDAAMDSDLDSTADGFAPCMDKGPNVFT